MGIITFCRIRNAFSVLKQEGWLGIKYRFYLIRDREKNKGINAHREYDVYLMGEDAVKNIRRADELDPIVFETCEKPLVSIIIPVYNQAVYTYYCLKSIQKYTEDVDYEIIIGDDCSTDITSEMEKWVRGIRIIHHRENCQFLINCNKISKEAKGKYVVFLNSDTQVQPRWLKVLVDAMETDENVGLAGSKLVYPDGFVQEAGGIVWRDAYVLQYGNGWQSGVEELNFMREVDYISGASLMIRRKLWEEIGGFDESFVPAYYEDVDLAFQVRERGYKVVYLPESEVVHFEGATESMDGGRMDMIERNRRKFLEKWGEVLNKQHYRESEYMIVAKQIRR